AADSAIDPQTRARRENGCRRNGGTGSMKIPNSKLQTPKVLLSLLALCICIAPMSVHASSGPLQSPRLERAKDLIAEEQWVRAIARWRAAAADAGEKNKDEARCWLADSQHQARALAGAVGRVARLEREHPASRWVKPARSLRIE